MTILSLGWSVFRFTCGGCHKIVIPTEVEGPAVPLPRSWVLAQNRLFLLREPHGVHQRHGSPQEIRQSVVKGSAVRLGSLKSSLEGGQRMFFRLYNDARLDVTILPGGPYVNTDQQVATMRDFAFPGQDQRSFAGVLSALVNDVVLRLSCPGPDMYMLPIVPDLHRACRLSPQRFVMKRSSVRSQGINSSPDLHRVDKHLRVVTGRHTRTILSPKAVHADRLHVRLLEHGVLIIWDWFHFGRRHRAEDERDEQSFHGGKPPARFTLQDATRALPLLTHYFGSASLKVAP